MKNSYDEHDKPLKISDECNKIPSGWKCPGCENIYSPDMKCCPKCVGAGSIYCSDGKIRFSDGTEMLD